MTERYSSTILINFSWVSARLLSSSHRVSGSLCSCPFHYPRLPGVFHSHCETYYAMVEDTSQNIMQEFIIIFLNGSGNAINSHLYGMFSYTSRSHTVILSCHSITDCDA